MLYFAIQQLTYRMSCQQTSLAEEIYTALGDAVSDYLEGTVLPALQDKTGPALLRELCERW